MAQTLSAPRHARLTSYHELPRDRLILTIIGGMAAPYNGPSGLNVAMLGEIGVVLIRPINDCWALRIGYNAIGIGGLALAADQLDFTDTFSSGTGIHNTGWIFAHGGLVGVQAAW